MGCMKELVVKYSFEGSNIWQDKRNIFPSALEEHIKQQLPFQRTQIQFCHNKLKKYSEVKK